MLHQNPSKKEVVTENRAHLNPAGSEAGAKPDYSIKTMVSSKGRTPDARAMVDPNRSLKGDATKLEIANDRHPRPAVMRVSFFACASLDPRQPRPLPGALFLVEASSRRVTGASCAIARISAASISKCVIFGRSLPQRVIFLAVSVGSFRILVWRFPKFQPPGSEKAYISAAVSPQRVYRSGFSPPGREALNDGSSQVLNGRSKKVIHG